MNKMYLQILGFDGNPLGSVPFDTDHVTWAIRNSGFYGRVSEGLIAQYISNLIQQAGDNWERQKVEWVKKTVADRYVPGGDLAAVQQEVNSIVQKHLSWEPFEGFDDSGKPLTPPMPE